MNRHAFFSAALVAALSFSLGVSAQDDRARLHFQAGASYYEAGDYEDALREFQRSHALSQRAELFYNFSLCYQQLGDLNNAALYLRRYLDEVQAIENRDQLERRHQNLVQRIAAGHTTLPPDPPPAGEPGEEPTEAGEPVTAVEPAETPDGPAGAPDAPTEASSDESNGRRVPVGAIVGYAVAGAGAVVALTFGPLALRERSSVEDGCGATRSCTSAQVKRMDGFALAADIGLGVAVAGAAVGTILLLTGRRGDDEPEGQARMRISPYATRTGAGAVVGGSF